MEDFEPIINLSNKPVVFKLEGLELEKANDWIKSQLKKTNNRVGTAGDRFEYRFSPTGLGTIVSIYDNLTKENKDVTNFENW